MKTRVYDLAKELGVDSKSLVDVVIALGFEVKTHMSAISPEAADAVRVSRGAPPKLRPKPKPKKVAPEEDAKEEAKDAETAKKKPAAKKTATAAETTEETQKPAVKKKAAAKKDEPTDLPEDEKPADESKEADPPEKKPVEKKKAAAKKADVPEAEPVAEPVEEPVAEPAAPPTEQEEAAKAPAEPKPEAEKPAAAKEAKPKAKPKSRIIGKIDLPAHVVEEAGKPKRKGRGGEGTAGANDGRQSRPRKKKVFFTKTGQPLYHQRSKRPSNQPKIVIPDELTVTMPTTVKELSALMGVKSQAIIKKLMMTGQMLRVNDFLDEEAIQMIGLEFGKQIDVQQPKSVDETLAEEETPDAPEQMTTRAPVVTLMGHVDHGKTSLLDRIRQSRVASGESGGITQHIGAYQVEAGGRLITFLDTPGHEAFTAMRARGAHVTDLVILVVAADDGVMPQTEEAINHAQAAGVPIVVAVNKVDKSDADPMKTRQQLSTLGLAPEEWGGKTIFVEVSATTGQGVDELIELLGLEAEMLELKANADRPANGVVLESRLSRGLGAVATVLVQRGTLRKGDVVLSGAVYGRVRQILDYNGKELDEALPSTPVALIGFPEPPEADARFRVTKDIQTAREIAEQRVDEIKVAVQAPRTHTTLESLYSSIELGQVKDLRVIIKADVKGSLEVLLASLSSMSTNEVKVSIIHSAVGGINESDVLLADASDAIVIGFHVVPDERGRKLAKQLGVDVRLYEVIYQVTDEIRASLEGMLEPEKRESVLGHAEVRETFKVSRSGNIAGCYVTDGRFERSNRVRLIRDGVVIYSGKLESLRRFKDDVKEVKESFECGIKIAGYGDVKVGDVIETYQIETVARTLADSK